MKIRNPIRSATAQAGYKIVVEKQDDTIMVSISLNGKELWSGSYEAFEATTLDLPKPVILDVHRMYMTAIVTP